MSPIRMGIQAGLVLAVGIVIADFLLRKANLSFASYFMVTALVLGLVNIAGVILAHRAFKRANNGWMTLSQGVIMAVIMLTISGLVGGVFNYVYLTYVDIDFVLKLKNGMRIYLEKLNMSDKAVERSLARFDEMKVGLGKSAVGGISNGATFGLILGLIISIFTKRTPPDFA